MPAFLNVMYSTLSKGDGRFMKNNIYIGWCCVLSFAFAPIILIATISKSHAVILVWYANIEAVLAGYKFHLGT